MRTKPNPRGQLKRSRSTIRERAVFYVFLPFYFVLLFENATRWNCQHKMRKILYHKTK